MNRKWRCVAAFCLFATLACVGLSASAQQLELRIALADTTYLMGEPMWLDAELTNISEDTLRIWGFEFPGGSRLKLTLTDEQGDTLPFRYQGDYFGWPGFILGPGETYFEAFALSEIFFSDSVPAPFPLYSIGAGTLAPGRYNVSAQYRRRYGDDIITAAPLCFSVVEPTGVEREALDLLLKIYGSGMGSKHDRAAELLTRLLSTYPKSVYLERAYLMVDKKRLIEKWPDTGYLNGYLDTAVEKISDQKEKREFLQDIMQRHPGTRTAKYAQQKLRRLERGE